MQIENKKTILKKVTSKEKEASLIYKNTANNVKDAHLRTTLKEFTEQELKYVEIFNILYMHQLKIWIEEAIR